MTEPITDEKLITQVINFFTKINGKFKKAANAAGANHNISYTMHHGLFFSYNQKQQIPYYFSIEPNYNKPTEFLAPILKELSLTINTVEYFEFTKKHKDCPTYAIDFDPAVGITFHMAADNTFILPATEATNEAIVEKITDFKQDLTTLSTIPINNPAFIDEILDYDSHLTYRFEISNYTDSSKAQVALVRDFEAITDKENKLYLTLNSPIILGLSKKKLKAGPKYSPWSIDVCQINSLKDQHIYYIRFNSVDIKLWKGSNVVESFVIVDY